MSSYLGGKEMRETCGINDFSWCFNVESPGGVLTVGRSVRCSEVLELGPDSGCITQ